VARRSRRWLTPALLVSFVASAPLAHAQPGSEPSSDTVARTNFNLVPIVGGNSDVGAAVGAVAVVQRLKAGASGAHVGPDALPYRWRIVSAGIVTFKTAGELRSPYQDAYTLLVFPELARGVLRLELRPSYTQETTQKYHGLGNASPGGAGRAHEYGRIHPTLAVRARLRLADNFFLRVGNALTYNIVDVAPRSLLARDREQGSDFVRDALSGPDEHAVDIFEYVLAYDARDSEVSATRGQFHHALVRLSPGGSSDFPYRYAQANLTLRGYHSPLRHLTLAGRVVLDAQFGDPPFYELARYSEDTFAIGGSKGVRGVPGQRYYGKLKLFGNLEARARLVPFRIFGKPHELGAAAFFDGGRLWAGYERQPELDGTGIGLKYGVGGGLRLHQGRTFVVRADVAYSPDARPVGAYFELGEMF
jgi:hypothetical protein